jgi:hypothetical protein
VLRCCGAVCCGAVCCVLCAVCCVLCAVCCVLCAVVLCGGAVRSRRAKRQRLELYGLALSQVKSRQGLALSASKSGLESGPVPGDGVAVEAEAKEDEAPPAEEGSEQGGEETAVEGGVEGSVEGREEGGVEGGAGVLTSVVQDDDGLFALALLRPPAAVVGTRVRVGGMRGTVVELPFATRTRVAGDGGDGGDEDDDAAAKAAEAKAAEAERKAKKLAAMQAKMKALGLA